MAQATEIYDFQDALAFTISTERRIDVPLAEVSPVMVDAVLSIEDQRFYQHGGFDPIRIVSAAMTNLKAGRAAQGASTNGPVRWDKPVLTVHVADAAAWSGTDVEGALAQWAPAFALVLTDDVAADITLTTGPTVSREAARTPSPPSTARRSRTVGSTFPPASRGSA